ncbi:MAG TPA: hypothetical protein VM513_25505 [Kofleriaceae bacterium]|jgi:hypothetical protein|nr:hypothetical protein [Kofleriaceae bacterium]
MKSLDHETSLLVQTAVAGGVAAPSTPTRLGAIVSSSPKVAMRAGRELLRMKPAG